VWSNTSGYDSSIEDLVVLPTHPWNSNELHVLSRTIEYYIYINK